MNLNWGAITWKILLLDHLLTHINNLLVSILQIEVAMLEQINFLFLFMSFYHHPGLLVEESVSTHIINLTQCSFYDIDILLKLIIFDLEHFSHALAWH